MTKEAKATAIKNKLDNAYASKSHTHGNLQNDGKVGTSNNANKNVVTDSNGEITTENKPTIPSASSTTPSADTTNGSVGSGTTWAKADHTHPKSSLYATSDHTHSGYLTSSDISGKIDTAGTGLSKSGTTLNHSNSVTAQTSTALKKIKYDAQGHITGTDSVAAGDLPSHTHNYATTSDVDTEIESYFNQINSQAGAYEYILNLVYPVGSIYMSVNSTSPATLFGGTWTQLTNTFLYASTTADTDATTATAGSKDAVVVEHTHNFNQSFGNHYNGGGIQKINRTTWVEDNSSSIYFAIQNTGVSGTDKNMPPYMKVYMWKRTG